MKSGSSRWLVLALAPAAATAAVLTPVKAPGGFVPLGAVAFSAPGEVAVAVTAATPLPVSDHAGASSWTDRSGAITAAATAQMLAGPNAERRGLMIQNLSDSDLWLGIGSTAAGQSPALRIAAGALYETPVSGAPANALSIYGVVAGQHYTAKEW